MHQAPVTATALPDSGFTTGGCFWFSAHRALGEACVAENGGVFIQPAHMRSHHGDGDAAWIGPGLWLFWKIKSVKRKPFHQVPLCFGFKAGEIAMAKSLIALPVSLADRFQHLLIQSNDLLTAC